MVRAQVVWDDVDRLPVYAANQFLVQLSVSEPQNPTSEVVLTVGYLPPPVFLGTPEEQQEAAARVEHVTVRPVARFSMSVSKAGDLAQILQGLLNRLDPSGQQP